MSEVKRPLEGVKVLELATFIAAPCCARFLADLGAEVIKVEAPAGDPLRYTAVNEGRPQDQKENTSYDLENAGKTCVCLNTKTPAGREALEKLGYEFVEAQVEMVPQNYITLTDEGDIKNMSKMLEMFDDNEDVQNVWHNWENEE